MIKFYADLENQTDNNRFNYDYKKYGEDSEIKNELIYCLKQWYKICEYVQRVHLYEILKMRVQFVKDDDGKVWLNYAKDIVVRKISFDYAKQHVMEKEKMINQQAKEELIKDITQHFDSKKSSKNIYSIYTIMDKHYHNMKKGIGINKWLEDEEFDDQDQLMENAFKILRPNSPYKLKEIVLKEKFDPK